MFPTSHTQPEVEMKHVKYISTTKAAVKLKRSDARIRQVCREHGIGTKITGNARLLTPDDVALLRKIFAAYAEAK